MSVTLYEHQHHGINFLLQHKQAVLGDEMGLGKTLQAILACEQLIKKGEADEVIVVCPRALKLNWRNEILKFTATPADGIVIVEGSPKTRELLLQAPRRWLLINYEMLRIEGDKLLASQSQRRFIMVCDESHRIKNRKAKQSKACVRLGELATHRYLLSGTFVANKPEDIWHQMKFLDAGEMLGSYSSFLRSYCKTKIVYFNSNRIEKIVGYRNLHRLKHQLGTVMLRRTKEQCLDLPTKMVQKIPVRMTNKQTKFYRQVASMIARSWSPDSSLQRMTYALQAASNPALIQPQAKIADLKAQRSLTPTQRNMLEFWQALPTLSVEDGGKLQALDDLLNLYCQEEKRKVILWTFYVGNIKLFSERYRQFQPAMFYGQSSDKQRIAALQRLQDDPDCLLFIANPQAAGIGLNLTQASLCIFFDRNFSSVDYQQAVDRIHRIGQTQDCHILLLQTQKSIDWLIDAVHENKIQINEYLQDHEVAKMLAGEDSAKD